MVIVSQTNSGFSLLEMILVMCIITSLSVVVLSKNNELELEHLYFINDYLYEQSLALSQRESREYEKGIRFNSMGHVNRADTISFNTKAVVVHLGNGYVTIK